LKSNDGLPDRLPGSQATKPETNYRQVPDSSYCGPKNKRSNKRLSSAQTRRSSHWRQIIRCSPGIKAIGYIPNMLEVIVHGATLVAKQAVCLLSAYC
jgi:hypothetical protein